MIIYRTGRIEARRAECGTCLFTLSVRPVSLYCTHNSNPSDSWGVYPGGEHPVPCSVRSLFCRARDIESERNELEN